MISVSTLTDELKLAYVEVEEEAWDDLVKFVEDHYQDHATGDAPILSQPGFRALESIVKQTEKNRQHAELVSKS